MRRGLMVFLACGLMLPGLTGCLWLTGAAVVAIVATDNSESGGSGPDPVVVPEAVLESPFHPLEGNPTDVLMEDIDGDEDLDVAVVSRTTLAVTVLWGDGTGNLSDAIVVQLSAGAGTPLSFTTASIDGTSKSKDILVATSDTLECIRWNGQNLESLAPLPLCHEIELRDIAVANFDGNEMLDVAVTCKFANQVNLFLDLTIQAGALAFGSASALPARSPRAVAAANFDLIGASDLAILEFEVESGPVIRLYLSKGTNFKQVDELRILDLVVDAGALLEAKDDVFFGIDPGEEPGRGPVPDLLANRRRLPAKILVDHTESGPKLRPSEGPTGPSSLQTLDAALIRLPRCRKQPRGCDPQRPEVWDVVAADATRAAVVIAYSEKDGIRRGDDTLIYPLPGLLQALAVGDLNHDGEDDIVAASVNPPVLGVLLANAPAPGVEDAPFHYSYGGIIGEEPRTEIDLQEIVLGRRESSAPLLAVNGLAEGEVLVIPFENLDNFNLGGVQRLQFTDRIRSLATADVDQLHGDDIIVTGGTGQISVFRATRSAGFSNESLDFDLTEVSPVDPASRTFQTRSCHAALLDDNDAPDLVLPVHILDDDPSVEPAIAPEYFVAVILNPGTSNPAISFFKTLELPRRAVVANLNGDRTVDLVVAIEEMNKVHVLFGDPGAPGSFVDSPTDDRSALRPVELPGLTGESEPEIEFVWTDNQAKGSFGDPAQFILAGGGGVVGVYRVAQGDIPGASPLFVGPCQVYKGYDPESVSLFDIYGNGGLDLLISDEDLGQIVVLESRGDSGQGGCSPWEEEPRARLPVAGAPGDVVVHRNEKEIVVATGTDASAIIETYKIPSPCGDDCFFTPGPGLGLNQEPRRGGPTGLSAARQQDGSLLVASIVEDVGQEERYPFPVDPEPPEKGAVDLVSFRSDPSPGDLRSFSSLAAGFPMTRLEWEGGELDAVILGHFAGDDALVDLVGHAVSGGFLLFPRIDPGAETVPQPTVISFLEEPLLDLERVEISSGPDLCLAATSREVSLMDAKSGCTVIRSSTAGTITSVACGWSAASRDLPHLNVAVLDGVNLFAGSIDDLNNEDSLATDVSGIVGCRDLNGDDVDDIVLVDVVTSSLRVFLARRDGLFKDGVAAFSFTSPIEALELAFLDANGDGRTDVCLGTLRGDIHLLLGDGRGAFPAERASVVFAGPDLEGIRAVDLDGDGREEVLASVGVPGLVILRSRNGTR